ncbi:unnamed protein product [Rhizophagus irregularis]|uniref:Uncharacterized protein n=1 Tax=Rhizophagus irregularis TaxID=588596 RepID=A0A2N1NK10_9GLOM|nr:hypothetical protein RhiirC2_775128 [Rhizophagus irregularis]CAB4387379.1 unnamed protein product [Rhizophagus irregularis]CAB5374930.1 unnamed protein product [Rhizophagus irregularis]
MEHHRRSKWSIANIEQFTLKDLKEFIFALYQSPELEKDVATLAFSCNDEKYSGKGFISRHKDNPIKKASLAF